MFWLILMMIILFIVANLIMNPPQAWCDWVVDLATKNKDSESKKKLQS